MVKDWIQDSQMQRLFGYQVLIGLLSNVPVAITSYIFEDYVLVAICCILFFVTAIAYFVGKKLNFLFGVHLMLCIYFVCFFYAAFTHLVSHPLILVYPIIAGFAIMYSKNNFVEFFYAISCFFACSYTIYLQHIHFGSTDFTAEILPSILICIGLMIAFPLIIITNSNMLNSYQKQIEEKQLSLKQKNAELNTYINSNMQLENFAHLASHELKTPLTNISNLTSLLKMKSKSKLVDDEIELMEMVTSEVGRMNNLIADLLQFSMVKNTEVEFTKIDIKQLLDGLIESDFRDKVDFINLDISLKWITGHEGLLLQLFRNLIENALKFSDKCEDQHVEISSFENTDFYGFTVSDNGIGIKAEYKDQVFLIFKKLHSNSEYPGTGIGLSICKNIVERHDGNITIEDNPTGGSAVKFTISKKLET